jgi:uncharacterized membrane protein YphA (DoxX/SURF4 family)
MNTTNRPSRKLNIALWTLQVLLGLFFIAGSGAPKLLLPADALPMPIPLPDWFIHLIGVCEVLGGLALIVPGIVRIQTRLTPIAAACLVALTACATVYQLLASQPANAGFALTMGVLCAIVAYGRGRLAPLRDAVSRAALAPSTPRL